jgi:hypothetical protein
MGGETGEQRMTARQRSPRTFRPALIAVITVAALWLSACTGASPRIVVEPATRDLGEVLQQPLAVSYTVRNQGDAPLRVERITTSCGCTEAVIDQDTIPPGESTQLRVTLDPTEDDLSGDQVRVIYIRSNDPKTPEAEVEFRANIRKAGS